MFSLSQQSLQFLICIPFFHCSNHPCSTCTKCSFPFRNFKAFSQLFLFILSLFQLWYRLPFILMLSLYFFWLQPRSEMLSPFPPYSGVSLSMQSNSCKMEGGSPAAHRLPWSSPPGVRGPSSEAHGGTLHNLEARIISYTGSPHEQRRLPASELHLQNSQGAEKEKNSQAAS